LQVDEIAILDLASSELHFFSSLKELTLRSANHIESENMEDLMSVLQEKQVLISRYKVFAEEWNKIGLSLEIKDGYYNPDFWNLLFQIFEAKSSKKGPFSVKLRELIGQTKTLAEELVKIEDGLQEALNEYVKRLRIRISQISKGRDACKGYASAGGAPLFGR